MASTYERHFLQDVVVQALEVVELHLAEQGQLQAVALRDRARQLGLAAQQTQERFYRLR